MKVATQNLKMSANGAKTEKNTKNDTNDIKTVSVPQTTNTTLTTLNNPMKTKPTKINPTSKANLAWNRMHSMRQSNDKEKSTTNTTNNEQPTEQQPTEKPNEQPNENNNNNNQPKNNDIKKLDPTKAATKLESKWNIAVQPTTMNEELNVVVIVEGILQAIQVLHPTGWIKANDGTNKGIYNINELPSTIKEANSFIEGLRKSKYGKLMFRITIVTDIKMDSIVYDKTFKQWLRNQKIHMDVSELETTNPQYVGFIDTPLPEYRKINLMKARFNKNYPTEKGRYQVILAPIIIDGQNYSSTFYMIVSDKFDVNYYQQLFLNTNETIGANFYPWNQFEACTKNQKIEIVKQQNTYYAMYKTTLIYNFSDENPPIKLQPKN
jgi:hypothetical protein